MIDTDKYEGHSQTTTTGFKSESVFDESGRQIASVKLAGYDTKRVKETYANLLLITDAPKLLAEVKRLREAIADVATNMEAADASYMGGFIEDLWKVIE
jgi:hypothetical protein